MYEESKILEKNLLDEFLKELCESISAGIPKKRGNP